MSAKSYLPCSASKAVVAALIKEGQTIIATRNMEQRPFSSKAAEKTSPIHEALFDKPPSDDELAERFRPFYESGTPVILRNAFDSMQKWQDLDFLLEKVGPDHVCDVEMGSYNSGNRLSIPFIQYVEYLRLCLEKTGDTKSEDLPNEHIVYLAQNDLPEGLREHVNIPSICTDTSIGEGRLYNTMLWMGPAGTMSPLHFDPLDNFLMQAVGKKRVFLLPSDTNQTSLYKGEKFGQQPNTSSVDVENPDIHIFPLFASVLPSVISGELRPNDALFIPAKWWHAVKSLDFSISVNAWWR